MIAYQMMSMIAALVVVAIFVVIGSLPHAGSATVIAAVTFATLLQTQRHGATLADRLLYATAVTMAVLIAALVGR